MAVKRRKDDEQQPGQDRTAKKAHIKAQAPAETATPNSSEGVRKKAAPSRAAEEGDEPDFPRGGASALTPAEIREARLQAESEFQEEISKKPKKGKKDEQRPNAAASTGEDEPLFRVGGTVGKLPTSAQILRYKSLSVGWKVWGAVAEVNHRDLVVSLPGGLRGFVQMEEASDVLADLMKKDGNSKKVVGKKPKRKGKANYVEDIEDETTQQDDEDDSSDESGGLSLKDFFSVGQLVTCRIINLEQRRAKGGKLKDSKRIGLSLRLSYIHEGLTIDVVQEGLVLIMGQSGQGPPNFQLLNRLTFHVIVGRRITANHRLREQYGRPWLSSDVWCPWHLGLSLTSEFFEDEGKSKLKRGQLVQGVVLSVDKKRGTVSLKGGPKAVAGSMIQEQQGLTMELLQPGVSVNARVRAVLRNGLLLSFLTYFTGTVDMFHLDSALLGSKWSEKYAENQRLKAKILYVDPITKSVGLTVNTDLLHSTAPSFMEDMGATFDNAIVRRVDPTVGLLLELPTKPTPSAGYAHISNVSDEHVEKLEKKFSEGKKVRARVTGFRMMDGLATVSLKKTVLDQLLLSHTDVKPGMLVPANVTAVEPFGAIVLLGDTLKALCPLQHMSEYQRVAPSPKFQVGGRLKFRVLTCDPQSKKITLTHKKTLVSSKLTPITSYDDAVEGLVTHGWITGFADFGCFVSFYNDVKGLAHRTELGITPGTRAKTAFQLGQCVKC